VFFKLANGLMKISFSSL